MTNILASKDLNSPPLESELLKAHHKKQEHFELPFNSSTRRNEKKLPSTRDETKVLGGYFLVSNEPQGCLELLLGGRRNMVPKGLN